MTEPDLVAAVLIAEAGGETDPRSMPAVLEVIRNRVCSRWPTLTAVVRAPKQFSCLNGTSDAPFMAKAQAHPKWSEALGLVASPSTNYTEGATNYCRVDLHPYWEPFMHQTIVIQHHKFFVAKTTL